MTPSERSEEELFERLLCLDSPDDRRALLDEISRDNPTLRRRAEELLECHDEAGDRNFLNGAPPPPAAGSASDPLSPEGPGTMIGRYRLLEKIGEGGFGVVYGAEQREPMVRPVALKIIKLGMDTREVIARFEAERQALALMDHPNIAKVFDAGATQSGRPYFVMERVQGISITRYCEQARLPLPKRLEIFITICSAIQHAHQKGIIHRDVKPSNVLIMIQDGQAVPKVIDFGIAKAIQHRLTDDTILTHQQQFIGTPAYMSPEQASGGGSDIDTRSDIYSLGVLLYELLTGVPPLDTRRLLAAGYDALCRAIREEEPVRPSIRVAGLGDVARAALARDFKASPAELPVLLRGDLDWIVMKALAKDRSGRYETAIDFAQDLQRHLQNEPVTAVAPSRSYILRKYARRHRTVLAVFTLIALVLVASSSFSFWKARQATAARRETSDALARAETNAALATLERNKARLQSSQSDRLLADQWLGQNQVSKAMLHLARSLRSDPENPATFKRLMSTMAQRHVALRTAGPATPDTQGLEGHFNADGTRLVVVNEDLTLKFFETATGRQVRSRERLENLNHGLRVRFTRDGSRAVTLEVDGGAFHVWDLETARRANPGFHHPPACLHFAITPDDRLILSSGADSRIRFWDPNSGKERFEPIVLEMPQKTFALAMQGTKLLVSQGYRKVLQSWDISADHAPAPSPNQFPFTRETENIFLLDAISPDGRTLIVNQHKSQPRSPTEAGGMRNSFSAWDIPSATPIWENDSMREEMAGLAWTADGTRLLVANLAGDLQIRSGMNGNLIHPIPLKEIGGYRESPDHRLWIVQDDAIGRIFFLGSQNGQEILPATEIGASGFRLALDPRRPRLLYHVAHQSNGLQRLDYGGTGALPYPLVTPPVGAVFGDVSPDWNTSAWISRDGRLLAISNPSGQPLSPAPPEKVPIAEARFAGNGSRILTVAHDRQSVTCREWPGQRRVSQFALPPPGRIGKWALNADASGMVFVVDAPGEWGYPGTKQVYFWDAESGHDPVLLDTVDGDYIDLAISPDGSSVLLTLRQAGAVLFRKDDGWKKLHPFGLDPITTGAFSHDGRWLALVSSQFGARVYDLGNDKWSLHSLPNREFGEATQARFSASDAWLFITGLRKPPRRIGDIATRSDRLPAETGLVWDWRRGGIASDRLALDGRRPLGFSPDENRFVLVGNSGPEVVDLSPGTPTVPEWLHTFVEGYCGYRFDSEGQVEQTPPPAFESLEPWVGELLRHEPPSPLAQWCRWLVSDRTQRPISPGTSRTLPAHVQQLLESSRAADVAEAWRLAPFDSRTLARQAASLLQREDPAALRQGNWMMEEAFRKDPDSHDAWFAQAVARARSGDLPGSLNSIDLALAGDTRQWLYHRLRAQVLDRLNRPEAADDAYDRAITLLDGIGERPNSLDLAKMRFVRIGLQRRLGRIDEAQSTQDQLFRIPMRDPSLPPSLVDLTEFYNAGLNHDWHASEGGNLSAMSPGLNVLNGVPFDVRGILQLRCGLMLWNQNHTMLTNQYPRRVDGIPIGTAAGKIHFLQASLFGSSSFAPKGTPVVSYVIRYADDGREEFQLRLGEKTRDWWIGKPANSPAFSPEPDLELAWQAYIPDGNVGLFKTTWINPRPSVHVISIDIVSAMNTPGPFLLAITTEEPGG